MKNRPTRSTTFYVERTLLGLLLVASVFFSVSLYHKVFHQFSLLVFILSYIGLIMYYAVLQIRSVYAAMYILFLILIAGAFFKLMHWPGAGLLLVIGQGFGQSLLFPTVLLYMSTTQYSQRFMVKILLFIVAVLLVTPVAFKLFTGDAYPYSTFTSLFTIGLVVLSKVVKVFRTREQEGQFLNVIGFLSFFQTVLSLL